MSTKSNKTIDNLGIKTYTSYEEGRKYLDETLVSESKNIAGQIAKDIFQPMLKTDYQSMFTMDVTGTSWGIMDMPDGYSDQKGRLFTYQLAPKLGPEELLDSQIERIEDQQNREKEDREKKRKHAQFMWEEESSEEIDKESKKLIELLKDLNVMNKIVIAISSERFRYSKG